MQVQSLFSNYVAAGEAAVQVGSFGRMTGEEGLGDRMERENGFIRVFVVQGSKPFSTPFPHPSEGVHNPYQNPNPITISQCPSALTPTSPPPLTQPQDWCELSTVLHGGLTELLEADPAALDQLLCELSKVGTRMGCGLWVEITYT